MDTNAKNRGTWLHFLKRNFLAIWWGFHNTRRFCRLSWFKTARACYSSPVQNSCGPPAKPPPIVSMQPDALFVGLSKAACTRHVLHSPFKFSFFIHLSLHRRKSVDTEAVRIWQKYHSRTGSTLLWNKPSFVFLLYDLDFLHFSKNIEGVTSFWKPVPDVYTCILCHCPKLCC